MSPSLLSDAPLSRPVPRITGGHFLVRVVGTEKWLEQGEATDRDLQELQLGGPQRCDLALALRQCVRDDALDDGEDAHPCPARPTAASGELIARLRGGAGQRRRRPPNASPCRQLLGQRGPRADIFIATFRRSFIAKSRIRLARPPRA